MSIDPCISSRVSPLPLDWCDSSTHLSTRSRVPHKLALLYDSKTLITMQPTDSQPTADIAACSTDNPSESSPLSSSSPRASTAPPDHISNFPANNYVNGRQPRSEVWLHFVKAADYMTSRKATCMHCNKTFMSRRGSTSTMHLHLKKNHASMLSTSAGAESLDR